jgi:poly-gamma-glutamate synthesis protein (capsule biosynthesis protein)
MHWGSEYQLNENSEQRDLARFIFRHGADAIIGSHPHVVQPIRGEGSGNLVVYSMGNLISNQRNRYRDGGILFEMELVKRPNGQEIESFAYLPVWVWKPSTKKGTSFSLVPASMDASSASQLGMLSEDRDLMVRFRDDTRLRLPDCRELVLPPGLTGSLR